MKILLPRVYNSREIRQEIDAEHPLIFLAGPVRGGGWWQAKMAALLQERMPECILAIPCRWQSDHPLGEYFVQASGRTFARQLDWERYYLEEAGVGAVPGSILFWLGCESKEFPHPGPESYAMDTRRELGKWGWRFAKDRARVVFGAEEDFFGLNVLEHDISEDAGHAERFWRSMEETADAAVAATKIHLGRE